MNILAILVSIYMFIAFVLFLYSTWKVSYGLQNGELRPQAGMDTKTFSKVAVFACIVLALIWPVSFIVANFRKRDDDD